MWLTLLLNLPRLLLNSKITAFIKEHLQLCIGIAAAVMVLYSVYHLGAESVQKKWDAEKAEIAAQIAQNTADNNILNATLRGNLHGQIIGIGNDLDISNSVSASFGTFAESGSTAGTFSTAGSGGISATGTGIAAERKAITDALVDIAKQRNLLAKHAKTNTVKLIGLQQFNRESK